ncbi:AlpA family phage regulatory protein [Xanthomonas phaseoli]|nr:AlpA family phage regulatory protein [Xanthomonas phaseoli]
MRSRSSGLSTCRPSERLPSVLARVGRSRASLYRDIAAGQFPSPVKIGERAIGWDPREVDNWIAERFASVEACS